MTVKFPDVHALQDPEAQLERAFVDEFLSAKGYDHESLMALPEAERTRLLTEASVHAAAKLTEAEARARFVHELRGDR